MTLGQFEREIRCAAGKVFPAGLPADFRPFVCRGNPIECKVFIVGYNPARTMPKTDFWDINSGFKFVSWKAAYDQARLTPGAALAKPSNTRMRIEKIVEVVEECSCNKCKVLETNLYPIAAAHQNALRSWITKSSRAKSGDVPPTLVLETLLKLLSPTAIIAHGDEAYEWILQARSGLPGLAGTNGTIVPSPHLSDVRIFGGFAEYLGRQANRACCP